jgi:2-polyprenyl-3-methyl-5-hydroxy-6-metoxy-1,4-benzoquinol methylase
MMNTLDRKYFDDVYAANDDPWNFETSEYEKGKYAATISALTKNRYKSAFEIGCSVGVLTSLLSQKCSSILAVDISEKPLEIARRRMAANDSVEFRKMSVPAEFPDQMFDLILLSEVGYYLSMEDLTLLQHKLYNHLEPSGQLLLVHWTPLVHDYPLTGDQVHDCFTAFAKENHRMKKLSSMREEKYRLDLFEKVN